MVEYKNRAWFLKDDEKFSKRVYVMYDQENNGEYNDYFKFKSGIKLDSSPTEPLIFNVEKTPKATLEYLLEWDFLPNSTAIFLANEQALRVLEEIASGEFQAIPTKIVMYDGAVIDDYKLINIINRKKVLNEEKSILLPEEERREWSKYKTYFYDKNSIANDDLIIDYYTFLFLGSERLRQAVVKRKLRGMSFDESYAGIHFFLD